MSKTLVGYPPRDSCGGNRQENQIAKYVDQMIAQTYETQRKMYFVMCLIKKKYIMYN
jgi:hypothetical protein